MPEQITNLNSADGHIPSPENLTKMRNVLSGYVQKSRHLQRLLQKARRRYANAKVDILVRRFKFDVDQLEERLREAKGQEAWAQRMVDTMEMRMNCRKDGTGALVHNPFAKLKTLATK